MADPGIRVFLKDPDPFVVTETARAINDDLSISGALPDLARALADHRVQDEAFVRRAINANLREGKPENIDLLLSYIAFEGAPVAMRNEAMDALSTWAKPSVLDRVDGRFRGEVTRDPTPVRKTSSSLLKQMLSQKNPQLRVHAARALGKLVMTDATEVLMASLKKDAAAEVRTEALKALAKIPGSQMDQALGMAIADKEKMVRVAGLDLLRSASLSKERMVALLDDVIRNRTPEEKQAAITTLGTLPLANTETVLARLVDELAAGKLAKEVQFELADAIDSSGSAELRSRYASLSKNASPDSLKAAYAGALQGGDPQKGMMIFWANSSAQCVRCHAVDDYGGNVGPKLNGIASRLSREQLLEALIEPSARIAPGYGIVSLELKNGQKLNGVLQQEKPDGYLVKVGNSPDTLVKKSDVTNRINSPSSMPPMHLLLSKKEIRDVVAFLGSLQ
jgi:putative heme-binding domain-containing protein